MTTKIIPCLKLYGKISLFTFCLIGTTNIITTVSKKYESKVDRSNIHTGLHIQLPTNFIRIMAPQYYYNALLCKCVYNSIIWPKFYLTAIKTPSRALFWDDDIFIKNPCGIRKLLGWID